MSEQQRDGLSSREMYLMREAMNAASHYESLEQWLDEQISDAGHYVAQLLAHDADRLYGASMPKCDGNHGGPPCRDRECWNDDGHAVLTSILIDSVKDREPDFVIGNPNEPYLIRWWLRRDRDEGSIYLHQIRKSDDDRALHDHPWPSTSIILSGTLREILPDGARLLTPGSITSRSATDAHRLEVVDGPVWTLFITGAVEREWGFHCPQGWVHWREFTDPTTGGKTTGRGCGES